MSGRTTQQVLLHHWGTVDAPDSSPFSGDHLALYKLVTNPGRIHVLAPGEPFPLHGLKKP